MKLVVISKTMRSAGRVDKYCLLDVESKEVYFKTKAEAYKLMTKGIDIIGFSQNTQALHVNSYFSAIPKIGENPDKDVYTLVRKCITKEGCYYEVSDGVGNIENLTTDEIEERIKMGHVFNGMKAVGDLFAYCQKIPIKIMKGGS